MALQGQLLRATNACLPVSRAVHWLVGAAFTLPCVCCCLQQLKPLLPNFTPDITVLKNLATTLINDVESRITTLSNILISDTKPALYLE